MKTQMRTMVLALMVALLACGGPAPSPKLSITPSNVQVLIGGDGADFVAKLDNLSGPVTWKLVGPGSLSTTSGTTTKYTPPKSEEGTSATISANVGSTVAQANISIVKGENVLVPSKNPSGIVLELNAQFYSAGEQISFVVDFNKLTPPDKPGAVVVSGIDSKDIEYSELVHLGGSRYGSAKPIPVALAGETVKPVDSSMSLAPNERFFAMYFVDKKQPSLANVEESVIADIGIMERKDAGNSPVKVEPSIMLSSDEVTVPDGGKAVGTLIRKDELPVQVATEELIFYPKDDDQLKAFIDRSKGNIIAQQEIEASDPSKPAGKAYLIKVDPTKGDVAHLPQMLELYGEQGELLASKSQALGILALVLQYRLEGFAVAVNPRLQFQAAPSAVEAPSLTHTMRMVAARGQPGPCIPNDPARTCVENVPALWSYLALWGKDKARVNVAVLDNGFAANQDFRRPESGTLHECRVAPGSVNCAPGIAQGSPTVGGSLVGARTWHGTGVVTTMGGVINNGLSAGVAGQVAVPMLYHYGLAGYVFEFGLGIRHAVDAGASCINISAGYPCSILTTFGPDFDICSVPGRVGLCAAIHALLPTAVVNVCTVSVALNFFLPGISEVCTLTTVIVGTAASFTIQACIGGLGVALGNRVGPVQGAVNYALRQGVPIVASAGNQLSPSSFPQIVRDYVNFSDARLERWNIIPAVLPGVIAVGAVNNELSNEEFYGQRVDIWAPITSRYFAPANVDNIFSNLAPQEIGGTSAAAPYVSGTIAAMQAVNPSLDPRTPGLSAAQRAGIVSTIRSILVNTAFTNSQLVSLGYANQPVERRNLINPLGAAQAAGGLVLPNLQVMEYEQSLNFSEALRADDAPEQATALSTGATVLGSTIGLGPADAVGYTNQRDQDYYKLEFTGAASRVYSSTVTLRSLGISPLRVFNSTVGTLDPVTSTTDGPERIQTYRLFAQSGTTLPFAVGGAASVYKLTANPLTLVQPKVQIVEPITSGKPTVLVCANAPVIFKALASYPQALSLAVPDSSITWRKSSLGVLSKILGEGPTVVLYFQEPTTIVARAFDDPGASAELGVVTKVCTNTAPVVSITKPGRDLLYGDPESVLTDFEDHIPYREFVLEGIASDAEDGVLGGKSLEWTTDRTNIQNALLGTGNQIKVRLYSGFCQGDSHTITLTATDSNGNITRMTRRIELWQIC